MAQTATMTRDYASFIPSAAHAEPRVLTALEKLGWGPFFQSQLRVPEDGQPARVVEVHKSGLRVQGDGVDGFLTPDTEITVGDWVLYDPAHPGQSRLLDRKSVFARRAPGSEVRRQLIAANVDTVFIVSSCNRDFNIARLERYVVLAFEAEVAPVIVLTKSDLCDDTAPYLAAAQAISERVIVLAVNALSEAPIEALGPWCTVGQTVAFLGSSGVGKSTLVNALFGAGVAATGAMREGDSKGRHTTTTRKLRFTDAGCAVLDTPGMRELQLADVETGIAEMFADLVDLAAGCKFRDCRHETEPGCKIRAGLEAGTIDAARFQRWTKLAAEDRFNAASLADRKAGDKARDKALHRTIKEIQGRNRK